MKVKTYTALITIAVEDNEMLPTPLSISDRMDLILQTKVVTCYEKVSASFTSVVEGDVMAPGHDQPAESHEEKMTLMARGLRVQMVKQQHATLRDRAEGKLELFHPTLNEGSDID